MNMRSIKNIFAVLVLCGCIGCSGVKPAPAPADKADKQAAAPKQPSPEEIAKLTQPGEQHKALQPLIGKWNAKSKFWMDPSGKPEESTASVQRNWILGKRFVRENYIDHSKKAPFTGVGTLGYDNVSKQYVSSWVDTMTTSIMNSTGEADKSGTVFTFNSEVTCPMTGEAQKFRAELAIVNQNKNTYKMYTVGKDGKEVPVLEIEYSRVKG